MDFLHADRVWKCKFNTPHFYPHPPLTLPLVDTEETPSLPLRPALESCLSETQGCHNLSPRGKLNKIM